MKIIIAIFACAFVVVANPVFSAEPTEAEMKEAILQAMQNQGGSRSGNNSIAVNNSISGAAVTITKFKKIACEKAASRPGYNCDYEVSAGLNFHSNEGNQAGDRHAAGVNALMGMFVPKNTTSTQTKRFVYSEGQWKVLQN
jgi:hypothetical protein